jgi:hypothetical protein
LSQKKAIFGRKKAKKTAKKSKKKQKAMPENFFKTTGRELIQKGKLFLRLCNEEKI